MGNHTLSEKDIWKQGSSIIYIVVNHSWNFIAMYNILDWKRKKKGVKGKLKHLGWDWSWLKSSKNQNLKPSCTRHPSTSSISLPVPRLLHGLHNSWIWVKQNWQFFIPAEEDASFSCSWPDWLTASPPSLFRSLSWLLCFLCLCFFFTGCWLMKRNCSGIWNMQNIYKLSLCMTSFETSMILSQSFWYKLHL